MITRMGRGWGGGCELEILESFVSLFFFASWPVCLAEADKDGAAALLPSASQSGDQRCSLGWVDGGGTLRGFGSALIRVIITTGTHRHASICCWQPWLLRLSPWSEVIMRPAVLHCEPRISPQMLINRLLSLWVCWFLHGCLLCFSVPKEARKEEKSLKRSSLEGIY